MEGESRQNTDRRSGIERRRFVYFDYYPERRSGEDRRKEQRRRPQPYDHTDSRGNPIR